MSMRIGLLIVLLCAAPGRAEVVFPRDTTAHIVASPQNALEQRLLSRLSDYLSRVLRQPPRVTEKLEEVPATAPAIVLSSGTARIPLPIAPPAASPEGYALLTTQLDGHAVVAAIGAGDRGLKRAIQRMVIESRQEAAALVFPEMERIESPWIPRREWTVCPWTPQQVRGVFSNPHADRRLDITLYGEQQLADYAEMLDWFGYSGCQMMETSYSYGVFGSVAAFQSWQKRLANAVRQNGQELSLWVWAAQFSGFNWRDPDILAVSVPSKGAFEDPATRRVFEKYYDHYADLAPLVDLLIGHFYDPGVLADRTDVFQYMKLLEQKCRARNPHLRMGIDFWAAGPEYMQQLIDGGFQEYLLLETGFPMAAGDREKLHRQAKQHGLQLGVWGWYLTEYETDQLASMYVNARVLKDVYQRIQREGTDTYPVAYWSEMDAHHLNNIYSMYVAAQLLWNPARDPHELLAELVLGIWGPRNGPVVLKALELIEDVRSGPTWETYWWTTPQYRIGTDQPDEDLRRSDAAIAALDGLQDDPAFVSKFPLPFPPRTFIEVMMPHLRQIKAYAAFRLKLAELRKTAENGAGHDALQKMLDDAFVPIPEFNTWVGVFGTPETRAQDRQLRVLCDDLKLALNYPAALRYLEADRVFQLIESRRPSPNEPYSFPRASINEFFWNDAKLQDRLQKLIDDGLLEQTGDSVLRLR